MSKLKKKTIIFTVTNDLVHDRRMHRICKTLAGSGFKVELAGRIRKKSLPITVTSYKQKRLRCFYDKGKLFYIEYNIRLFFHLLFLKDIDIICAIDMDTLGAAYFAAKLRHKILVYDAHEYFSQVPEVISRPAVQKFWEKLEQYLIPKSRCSLYCKRGLSKHF